MLPNLLVIGAMKAGTSSLHHYLSVHPEIAMSETKELNFFIPRKNWSRGLEWYEAQFTVDAPVRGESSPGYTKYPTFEGVPETIKSVIPEAKLVYLLRDPIDRIVSHYMDSYAFGRVHGSIDEMLADLSDNHYLNCSKYFMQLERYLPHFPQESIMIVTLEDLRARRRETLQQVFSFLDVDESFYSDEYETRVYPSESFTRKTHAGYAMAAVASRVRSSHLRPLVPRFLARPARAYERRTAKPFVRPTVDERLRERLVEALEADVARLKAFTGLRFDAWSV